MPTSHSPVRDVRSFFWHAIKPATTNIKAMIIAIPQRVGERDAWRGDVILTPLNITDLPDWWSSWSKA